MLRYRCPNGTGHGSRKPEIRMEYVGNAPWPNTKGKGAWCLTKVREVGDVRNEARKAHVAMHFVRMQELCSDKKAGLRASGPQRKYKGRAVL